MKIELVDILRCPLTSKKLALVDAVIGEDGNILSGKLQEHDSGVCYPIISGVPRFVGGENYANNFGFQWNEFAKTQLDSYSGLDISADRFWAATKWASNDVDGKLVLDVGCGAGRFAEIALLAGARVVAVDYSSAIDACYENLRGYPNFHAIQGDIYSLPFAPGEFDYVYSLGVLQHTPDVKRAFFSLPPMLKRGGHLCVDFYWRRIRTMLHSKYLFRPITKRIAKIKLFNLLKLIVPSMLRISRELGKIPLLGIILKRLIPVANYAGIFPLNDAQLNEWALLDTFDMLAPEYDNPQSVGVIRGWAAELNLDNIAVYHSSHLVLTATIKQ
jgi:SAM-dependent methyltransferase